MPAQCLPMLVFIAAGFMTMTVSILYPETSLSLWLRIERLREERRARVRARRRVENSAKLKKYWVIDMAVLPDNKQRH